MSRRPNTRQVKAELFLKCGKVCMYSMEKYDKEKLVLHHHPPYRLTHHTIYEESYLLSEKIHKELHKLELDNKKEYNKIMKIIKKNKKILEKSRK